MSYLSKAPETESELLTRADAIAGLSLAQLARLTGWILPKNLLQAKGWVGQVIERALGAHSGSLPQPDFQHLGIELKTLPIDANGKPRESTYVCSISLCDLEQNWQDSLLYRKLARVLWVPIEAAPKIPLAERRIGSALIWSPSSEEEAILRQDWQEVIDMISLGQLEMVTARIGEYLQVRPKAANAKVLRRGINTEGERILTLPRGFYLRPSFTGQLMALALKVKA